MAKKPAPHADRPPTQPLHQWLAAQSRRRQLTAFAVVTAVVTVAAAVAYRAGGGPTLEYDRTMVTFVGFDSAGRMRIEPSDGAARTVRLLGLRDEAEQRLEPPDWLEPGNRLTLTEHIPEDDAAAGGMVYAYNEQGWLVNEKLIAEGFAAADTGVQHPLADWFGRLEGYARRSKVGVWAPQAEREVNP